MDLKILLFLTSVLVAVSAWSIPFYPVRGPAPLRVTRYAPHPPHFRPPAPGNPYPVHSDTHEEKWQRPKRNHHDFEDHDHDHRDTKGVTGPVHTFVKTDKNANYKWGVRHHVGNKYAS